MAQKNRPFLTYNEYLQTVPLDMRAFQREITHDSVKMRLVGVTTDIQAAFYVDDTGWWGLRVRSNGKTSFMNAKPAQMRENRKTKLRYYLFTDAFGYHKFIYSHQAVFIAHSGAPIPDGLTVDHIDGNIENNSPENLRLVTLAINCRDGGFLMKLRNQGWRPEVIAKPYLLRFYSRMAVIKGALSNRRYESICRYDFTHILYDTPEELTRYLEHRFNTQIEFAL